MRNAVYNVCEICSHTQLKKKRNENSKIEGKQKQKQNNKAEWPQVPGTIKRSLDWRFSRLCGQERDPRSSQAGKEAEFKVKVGS